MTRYLVPALLMATPALLPAQATQANLPQHIANDFIALAGGVHPGYRIVHAKGIIVTGTFAPSPGAKTLSRAPHFGRIAPTVYFAQGFSGHGVNTTALAGKLIAEAINGQASRFDLFEKIRHRDFPGGASLRTPALVLAMSWYRMLDAVGWR